MRKHSDKLAKCVLVLGFLLTAGCPNQQQRLPESGGDPLVGPEGLTIPKKGADAGATGTAVSIKAPLPLNNPSSSIAGMAVGGPLAGARPTPGIPVSGDGLGKKAWQESDGGKTVLKQPQPIVENGSVVQPVPVYNSNPVAGDSSLQQVKDQLKAKGALLMNEAPVAGGVQFVCMFPSPQDSAKLRTYTVTAVDAVTAARAVLDKVNQGQ